MDSALDISIRPNCPNLDSQVFQKNKIGKGERGEVGRVGTDSRSRTEVRSTTIRSAVPTSPKQVGTGLGRGRDSVLGRDGRSQATGQNAPHGNPRAAAQLLRRQKAAALGLCLVCTKRPRVKGTRCLECLVYRTSKSTPTPRTRPPAELPTARYARYRRECRCVRCGGPSPVYARCRGCRRYRVATSAVVPVAASGSQGRGERTPSRKSKDNASGRKP
jgi:hypothetical protein